MLKPNPLLPNTVEPSDYAPEGCVGLCYYQTSYAMKNKTPEQSTELLRRTKLARRDMGNLLFHFTRSKEDAPAMRILEKILEECALRGTSTWSHALIVYALQRRC